MRKMTILLILFVLPQIAAAEISVIPLPGNIRQLEGNGFIFNEKTQVIADAAVKPLAEQLDEYFRPAMGFHLSRGEKDTSENVVILKLNDALKDLGNEGYYLKVDSKTIRIEAKEPAGIFYGIQTLRQLLPVEIFSENKIVGRAWKVPSVEIEDCPQFSWRGNHLDVSRHFMPVEFIKKQIDLMALHKLNRFDWHLTDDQGWRIEIKKYPKLTKIGAWRDRTVINDYKDPNRVYEEKRYGGYYTKEQIREIVQYAKERYIDILPEIEMPGHSAAAIRSYPWLSCNGKGREYCPGNEEVFEFLDNVLREVMDLFPCKYIHIAGDEAKKINWRECPQCQARIASENLKDVDELQSYFVKRIEKFLLANNRRLIGWDEISQGGLASEATVMCRFGEKFTAGIVKQQHDVILSEMKYCYFDYYQGDKKFEPLAFPGYVPLDKVYSYVPIPAGLTPEQEKHVLGVQACLWTEYVRTSKHAEYMTYPRLCALAEVAWTESQKKNYDQFFTRLIEHVKRLDFYGVNYRRLDK